MFSWAGYFNWQVDALLLDELFVWELIKAFTRSDSGNWQYNTIEEGNFIDMNRLWEPEGVVDQFDREFWANKEDGMDCNGVTGKGYYCYCPS